MNKDNVIKLVRILYSNNYKDVFGAILLYEKIDYLDNLSELNDDDIKFLEKVFSEFLKSDCEGLVNDDIKDIISSLGGESDD